MGMHGIGEQNCEQAALRVNPQTGPGEAGVAVRGAGDARADRAPVAVGSLPAETPPKGQVVGAGLGHRRDDLRVKNTAPGYLAAREQRLPESGKVSRRAEQTRMAGYPAEYFGILVMD
jgi:hypothetical protein